MRGLSFGCWLVFGFPVVLSELSKWVMHLGDRAVLGYFMDATTLGIYGAAYTLAAVLTSLGGPFWMPMYPLMSSHLKGESENTDESRNAFCEVSAKYTTAFSFIAIPSLFGLCILSPDILKLLGTQQFVISTWTFTAIALSLFLHQFGSSTHYLVLLKNEPKFLRNITIASVSLNLALNILLVPHYGMAAAAVTTLLSYLFLEVCYLFKIYGYGFRIGELYRGRALLKYMFSASVMGLVVNQACQYFPEVTYGSLAYQTTLGCLAYFFVVLALSKFSINSVLR